ncbi:hypothetical protein [Sphingomicrobium flavum]|uniref:hypothetical protein n=1 Tax=Sphingomicrobium flavum TaxID=1229164 RepID=UPI0021AD6507|nr:hypothetical protein [Sphingomicrobium flavum]
MQQQSHEPKALTSYATPRHDGWTGERMAAFCETLADTGLVTDACAAVGMSTTGAYALRRRDPLFAAAWEAALTIARDRLADTLLARSIEGTKELYYKDGELVGEKKLIDNRLGLAILRRLDRLAETGHSLSPHGNPHPVRPERSRGALAMDWDMALAALQGDDPDLVAEALAMLRNETRTPEVDEVDDPPNSIDLAAPDSRLWWCNDGKEWRTSFPPPEDYDGFELGHWSDADYSRTLSPEELELVTANDQREQAEDLAEAGKARDTFFARLAVQLPIGS